MRGIENFRAGVDQILPALQHQVFIHGEYGRAGICTQGKAVHGQITHERLAGVQQDTEGPKSMAWCVYDPPRDAILVQVHSLIAYPDVNFHWRYLYQRHEQFVSAPEYPAPCCHTGRQGGKRLFQPVGFAIVHSHFGTGQLLYIPGAANIIPVAVGEQQQLHLPRCYSCFLQALFKRIYFARFPGIHSNDPVGLDEVALIETHVYCVNVCDCASPFFRLP